MKKSTSSKRTTSTKKPAVKKPAAKKPAAKKAPVKKVAAKKAPVKKVAAKKAPAKKVAAKKAPAKKVAAKKAPVKKVAEKKTPVKKVASKAKAVAEKMTEPKTPSAQDVGQMKDVPGDEQSKPSTGFSIDDVRRILEEKVPTSEAQGQAVGKKARKASSSKKAKAKKRKFSAASVADILGFNPNQKKTHEERLEEQVPKKFLPYYRVLIKLRDEFRDGLDSHSQGTLLTSSKEESGDLSTNSTDAGSESFDRDVALSMVASEQEALQEVEAAIDRMFDGTFGICQETGKAIKRDRLKAVPFTRFSLEGQALHEIGSGRQVQRGGIFTNLSESVPGMQTDGDS